MGLVRSVLDSRVCRIGLFSFALAAGPFASAAVQDWVYVARPVGEIDRISPSGVIDTFASGLPHPQALTFDQSGNLYVACRTGLSHQDSVRKIQPDGQISILASGLNDLSDITFDAASGDLFASSGAEGIISRITPQGAVSRYGAVPSVAGGLAMDSHSNLFVVTIKSEIFKIAPGGSSVSLFAGTNSPQLEGLTIDANDNLFATDPAIVWKITPSADVSVYASSPAPTHTALWYGLEFDSGGDLLVADLGTLQPGVRGISPSGGVTTFAQLSGVIDVATVPVPEPTPIMAFMAGLLTLFQRGNKEGLAQETARSAR